MSPLARLSGFAVLLAVVFAAAILAGDAIDPEPVGAGDPAAEADMGHAAGEEEAGAGHAGETETVAAPVRGLAVAESGLTLELADTALPRGRRAELAFRVLRADGGALDEFEVEHEKRMHLIVVRRDGSGFQHLHPRMAADGTWSTPITLPDAGSYRVFADFTTDGRASTLAADLAVDGPADYRTLPAAAATTRTTDGAYEVRLDAGEPRAGRDAMLEFTVRKDGEAVETEPYLGAGGHLVALRQGDLAYLHTHPAGHAEEEGAHGEVEPVAFESAFPSAGAYRLYFQFKHAGRVRTAEFTQEVSR
jgi:hypothetical protein